MGKDATEQQVQLFEKSWELYSQAIFQIAGLSVYTKIQEKYWQLKAEEEKNLR